jgi:aminopeptidase N
VIYFISGWQKDTYERTPKMSTYLVAFLVSEYKSISGTSKKHQIEIEVTSRPEAIDNHHADYALSQALIFIDYFIDILQIPYPLKKLS